MKTIYSLLIAITFMIVPIALPFDPSNLTFVGMLTIGVPSVILALEPNKERVTGRFLPKVVCSALPGSLAVLLGVLGICIAITYFSTSFTDQQIKDMFILLVTAVGFLNLLRVCFPFKRKEGIINGVMYGLLVGIFAIIYGVDIPVHISGLAKIFAKLGINENSVIKSFFKIGMVDWEMGKIVLVLFAVIVPIFVGMIFAFRLILKAVEKSLDEKERIKNENLIKAEQQKEQESASLV